MYIAVGEFCPVELWFGQVLCQAVSDIDSKAVHAAIGPEPQSLEKKKVGRRPTRPAWCHCPRQVERTCAACRSVYGTVGSPIPARFRSEGAEHDVQPDVAMQWMAKASWNGSEHGEAQRLVEP